MKTQTNVRYHHRRADDFHMPNAITTTIRKTGRFAGRATRKFVSQPADALLLCRMAWWVSVLSVASRCFSLPRALAIVAGPDPGATRPDDADVQQRLARLLDQLLSIDIFLFRPICWKRAAVLHRYLSRHGIRTRIIFGVRNDPEGKVAGHAWLEADGVPILESQPPDYVVTYRYPSNERFDALILTGL